MSPGRLKYLVPIKFKDGVLKYVKGKEAKYCSGKPLVSRQHHTEDFLRFISTLSAHLAEAGVFTLLMYAENQGSGRVVHCLRSHSESQEKTAKATKMSSGITS